jgi:hypothetical protein
MAELEQCVVVVGLRIPHVGRFQQRTAEGAGDGIAGSFGSLLIGAGRRFGIGVPLPVRPANEFTSWDAGCGNVNEGQARRSPRRSPMHLLETIQVKNGIDAISGGKEGRRLLEKK